MKVAILGTGPSAAYVAMACRSYQVKYEIISNKGPTSFFPGSFWARHNPLHYPVERTKVYISHVGSAMGYLKKQWGMVYPDWLEETSFPSQARYEDAYDPYKLFSIFWKNEHVHLIGDLSDDDIVNLAKRYDLVCMTFATEKSKEIMKPYIVRYPIVSVKALFNTSSYCIYDGEIGHYAVRFSNLFGYIHTEYTKDYIPSIELVGSGTITWVPDTTPDAPEWDPKDVLADNVILVGRFARWSRKVLSNDAYTRTAAMLEKML